MATQPLSHFTPDEYLEFDRTSEFSHEFIRGEIVPLVGATPWHSRITANAGRALGNRIDPQGCGVFVSGPRLLLDSKTAYAYPDVSVVCGQLEYSDEKKDTVTNPQIVVEVLSSTTRNYDLGLKLRLYWNIASLTDILLIEQEKVWIEHWRRSPGGEWAKRVLEDLHETVRLTCANCKVSDFEISVLDIYAGVHLS